MKNNLVKNTIKYFVLVIFFLFGNIVLLDASVFAGEMTMHTISIGRGDAIVICSGNQYMLIDSGTSDAASTIIDYLDKLNIPDKKIDYVISTHPDADHVGSFPAIFKEYTIGEIIYSSCTKGTTAYKNFVTSMEEEGCPYRYPKEGESWKLGDATVEVVYDGTQGTTYNECSIVLKVTCDGKTILLMGDLPSTMERSLMSQGYNFKADVLKVGHHGAAASSCADFLDAVTPEYAVISCADPSITDLPKPSTLKRLARRFIKTYRTTDGDIVLNFNNGKITTNNKENNGYICLKKATITLDNNVFYADGLEKKPVPTVYVNGVKVSPENYTVSYSSNKHTGIGTVKITGTEVKYVSVCRQRFLILPKTETLKGSVTKYNKVQLSWSAQSHASGFTIQYSTDKKFSKNVKTVTCNSSATLSKKISNLKFNTKYYFRIRAYTNNVGVGKWSDKISLKTAKKPIPSKATFKSYKLTSSNNIKLVWKKQSSSHKAGYKLQYSTDKNFKSSKKTKTIKYKKTSKNYRTLRNLKKNTTYYIRIQGYNSYGNGKWSKTIKVTTM